MCKTNPTGLVWFRLPPPISFSSIEMSHAGCRLNSGTGRAVNCGMKLSLLILLVAGSAVAQSRTEQAVSGSAARSAVNAIKPQPARTNKVSGTNDIRIMNGVIYDVRTATNWVTLPGPNERARYSRLSNYGPVFTLEKRMEVRYRQSSGDGTRTWYEPYQEIAIKNYPKQGLVAGAPLPMIRVMPIRTTSEGIAVYDHGTIPKAGPGNKP